MNLYQNYYLDTITKRFAKFDGRARRSEYWYFGLFNFLTVMAMSFMVGLLGIIHSYLGIIGFGLMYLLILGVAIPQLALTVRRLHDTGKSGWWLLIGIIPLVGAIVLFVFYCTEGDIGNNLYGPDPKSIDSDNVTDHLI